MQSNVSSKNCRSGGSNSNPASIEISYGQLLCDRVCTISVIEHKPIIHVDQLWDMHSLQEISGYVYLDLGFFGTKLGNLSFLENLVKVGGYPSDEHPDHIYQSELMDHMQIHVADKPDQHACATKGAVCHPNCDPMYGCWGPGLDQCVKCLNRRAGEHSCVLSCEELPGYMSEHTVGVEAANLTNQNQELEDATYRRNVSVDSKDEWANVHPTDAINHVLTGSPYADQVYHPSGSKEAKLPKIEVGIP
ncbi:uncharacterized protein DEA37_0014156 [Paragonimus westermani]|uniref:Uncharacterized protein n=1 Tax=Paragonimus westermani TaxID=34504 RepID=A0A5J4NWD3_9TREM|nr:uncharacterized protein DEA37_0014156 [Paragonimus westermani]